MFHPVCNFMTIYMIPSSARLFESNSDLFFDLFSWKSYNKINLVRMVKLKTYISFFELPFLIWIVSEKSFSASFCAQTILYFLGKNFQGWPLLLSSIESQRSICDRISTSHQDKDGNQASRLTCKNQPVMDSKLVLYHHLVSGIICELWNPVRKA